MGLIGTVHDTGLYLVLFLFVPVLSTRGRLKQVYCSLPFLVSVLPSLVLASINDIVIDFVRLPQLDRLWFVGPLILIYLTSALLHRPFRSGTSPWFLVLAWTLVMFDFTYYASTFLVALSPRHNVQPFVAIVFFQRHVLCDTISGGFDGSTYLAFCWERLGAVRDRHAGSSALGAFRDLPTH